MLSLTIVPEYILKDPAPQLKSNNAVMSSKQIYAPPPPPVAYVPPSLPHPHSDLLDKRMKRKRMIRFVVHPLFSPLPVSTVGSNSHLSTLW
jgi:hypothetical protein